ncbi:phosphoglucomutase [Ruminococcaceae bacterium YRB3002]|nr:phosphoglucomutase [Ruminococcaceae bacterium YRB3002]
MGYIDTYRFWCEDPFFDADTKAELLAIRDDSKEIEDRFYKDLEFGTAGFRGVLGAGTNRMNVYTVAKASAGLAQYIISCGTEAMNRGVVICYDSRHFSPEFAEVTASTLAAYGVKVKLSDELRPVPVCSYSIRYYKAFAGVMITASHNPSKYNGYKVYGEDGGQVPPEAAEIILRSIKAITDIRTIKSLPLSEAMAAGLVVKYGEEVDKAYTEMLAGLVIDQESINRQADMSIVYTPLHGSGNKPVRRILDRVGFKNVHIVSEQEKPDGSFPTVSVPNPENPEALTMAIELAKKTDASLVFGTDPDSDRIGVAAKTVVDGQVTYKCFTGNQMGLLLLDYILDSKKKLGTLPENSFAVTTIVSTKLAASVCKAFGVELMETLTGFKFIGERIKLYDEEGDMHFQFGFEESYGYLSGVDVRDKDAVVAAMLICGMAAQSFDMGETLVDRLERVYAKYGYGFENSVSFTLEGKEGIEKIGSAMAQMRHEMETSENAADAQVLIGGPKVIAVRDYLNSIRYEFTEDGVKTSPITLPKSNVLLYELGGDKGLDWACARPSGTEPKLKVYFGIYDTSREAAESRLAEVKDQMTGFVKGKLGLV